MTGYLLVHSKKVVQEGLPEKVEGEPSLQRWLLVVGRSYLRAFPAEGMLQGTETQAVHLVGMQCGCLVLLRSKIRGSLGVVLVGMKTTPIGSYI